MDRWRRGGWLIALLCCCAVAGGCLMGPDGRTGEGILEGQVSIGPICPVERPGETCTPSPDAYAARKVVVYGEGRKVVKVIDIDARGYYRAALKEGTYIIDINHAGMDRSGDVPAAVGIRAGATLTVDIAIDTGIR